ncbi:SDR family oxidoreductase [Smaragdicoccus niigatensis]|uniref:SDR family oxidoreductase n=1 Tax=Smaragdicoccus niigatensis TaxID=359359 RepID=UPI00037E5663|nr:SDR family oxidoreductase [Smaragdicoccus niigatensis]
MGNSHNLFGKVVAITGGARGIGRATAEAFIVAGAKVAIGDVDTDLVEKTAKEIGALGLPLDVTSRDSFESFVEEAELQLGKLDVLVNNAGIMPTGAFLDESDAVSDRQIDINIRGVVLGSKIGGKLFAARGHGHLVNIASVAGIAATPGVAVYCATKHAVVGLGSALNQELAPHGVKVTTICPPFTRTELISGLNANKFIQNVGMLDPEDIANAIVSDVASGNGGQHVLPWASFALLKTISLLPEATQYRISAILGLKKAIPLSDTAGRAAYLERIRGGLK